MFVPVGRHEGESSVKNVLSAESPPQGHKSTIPFYVIQKYTLSEQPSFI